MAPPTVAVATRARIGGGRCRTTVEWQRVAGQLGPARNPDPGADARQPDLAVDPPERLRCLTTAVDEPGSERQEER